MSAKRAIPSFDLKPEIDALWDELNAAIQSVLRSGQFIMGDEVRQLEAELAQYLGVEHTIALNSGTDALVIGLRALGIGPGDEVITTSFTFFATAEAISILGAVPVFVDIDPRTFNLDVNQIESRITPRSRAILPVHLFGLPAPMDVIQKIAEKHGLLVLEDVAQAMGARYQGRMVGTIGQVGAFSFFPTKNLGAYGDGGLIATNDPAVADTCRMLRAHGSRKKYHNEALGYNSRLDTLQAAILRVKMAHLEANNAARRAAAARYDAFLASWPGVVTPYAAPECEHVYHQYTIRILNGRRDAVQSRLAEMGVSTMVYYPVPCHRLPVYADFGLSLPAAEQAAREVLSLPFWPQIDEATQREVADCLRAALD